MIAPELKKKFVLYGAAMKAKALGFSEQCLAFYSSSANTGDTSYDQLWPAGVLDGQNNWTVKSEDLTNPNSCLAPMHQDIIDWARMEHKFHIKVTRDGGYWIVTCHDMSMESEESPESAGSTEHLVTKSDYYEALNAGIYEYLTIMLILNREANDK